MYTRLFYATVQPGHADEAQTVIDDLVPKIKGSRGCLHIQVLRGGDDIVGITDWESQDALAGYADGEIARELFSRLAPHLMGVPSTRSYEMVINL
jgi:quinol monooxygenase YgiN